MTGEWIDILSWTTKYCDYEFKITKSRHSESRNVIFEAVLTYPNGEVDTSDFHSTFDSAHETLNVMIIEELGETKLRVTFEEDTPDGKS